MILIRTPSPLQRKHDRGSEISLILKNDKNWLLQLATFAVMSSQVPKKITLLYVDHFKWKPLKEGIYVLYRGTIQ